MDEEEKNNLQNTNNYMDKLDITKRNIYSNKFIDILHQFLLYSSENIFIQDKKYFNYVIMKGIETITNIFNILLLYTKNIDLVYYHCQKSFYYYVEFIGQISDENNSYLKLSSKDAVLFVYRKTIFKISSEFKASFSTNQEEKQFLIDISNITREINKLIEFQLLYIEGESIDTKMKLIVSNNSKIFKHIYYKDYLHNILCISNKIISDLSPYFESQYIINVICYYNKKLLSFENKEEKMEEYSFKFNEEFLQLTPLRLCNILLQ